MLIKITGDRSKSITKLIINGVATLYNSYSHDNKIIIDNFINSIGQLVDSSMVASNIGDNFLVVFEYDSEIILDYYTDLIDYNLLSDSNKDIFNLFIENIL